MQEISYKSILQRMLDRVSGQIDKREGSIIYDALAPCAMELMFMYLELGRVVDESFADTASREYLIKRAAERGLEPTPATYAVLKGEFNIDVEIGSRFSCNQLNYIVISKIDDCEYQLRCETVGEIGNTNFGQLIPIEYIEGLETATLTQVLIPGEDEEDTEIFRTRYFKSFDSQSFAGNQADYIEKTNAIAGVGGVKVYPVWDGGGTVKLVIINSEFEKPSSELVSAVQEIVDPSDSSGEGLGFAPIGHIVTVEGVKNTTINIKSTFTFKSDYDFDSCSMLIENAIDEYFNDLKQSWESENELIVRISQIETRILDLDFIVDVEGTKLNNDTKNIVLESDEIPSLGVLTEDEQ